MGTYNTSVNYYRINANNTTIATSNNGIGSATEEIAAPTSTSGSFASTSGTTITGNGTAFTTNFAIGQYLYYINNVGAYVLVGQIDTITDADTLNLTAAPINTPTAGDVLAATYSLVTTSESIYIRVATQKSGGSLSANQAFIPKMSTWRVGNVPSAVNNPAVTRLDRVSNVGTPVSNGTVTPIPFTIQVMNTFTVNTGSATSSSWNTFDDIPSYIWLKASISGPAASLSSQTMYRFTTEETIEALTVTPQFSNQTLINNGYFNVTLQAGAGVNTTSAL